MDFIWVKFCPKVVFFLFGENSAELFMLMDDWKALKVLLTPGASSTVLMQRSIIRSLIRELLALGMISSMWR